MHRAARSEQLAAWAVIDIPCRIKAEVGTREGAVLPVRPVKHRDMWCDALLFDKPVQHRSRTVSGIARKPFRLETEALLCSVDHGPGGADLSLANGARCLNVNNDAKLHVDEVVVGVSKKCRSFVRSGPLCRGIGRGWRPQCRACRTSDTRGSLELRDRSAAPSGSQRGSRPKFFRTADAFRTRRY